MRTEVACRAQDTILGGLKIAHGRVVYRREMSEIAELPRGEHARWLENQHCIDLCATHVELDLKQSELDSCRHNDIKTELRSHSLKLSQILLATRRFHALTDQNP